MKRSEYLVRELDLSELHSIRDSWKRLQRGDDMTFFQKFEWYEMVGKFVPSGKGLVSGYFVVEKEGSAVMIAPLWVITRRIRMVNKPGVYILGRNGYSDYLNLIYDFFDEVAFQKLTEYVMNRYGVNVWNFEYLKSSALLSYIRRSVSQGVYVVKDESSVTCCGMSLPSCVEKYEASLSKSTRQNIRTAVNRSKKDNLNFVISYDDDCSRPQCNELRQIWQRKKVRRDKAGVSWKGKIYLKLRWFFYERFLIKFPHYSPIIDCNTTKILSLKDAQSDEIAAFFCYGMDLEHGVIIVITAGVNEKFIRYSPGFICVKDFICHCINEGNVNYIDFTRGTEPYKYWLGCKNNNVSNISISCNPVQ